MDDFRINILMDSGLQDDDFICIKFDNIPRIVVSYIISRKQLIPYFDENFEEIKFIYANDKEGIIELISDMKQYMNILDTKPINGKILYEYLNEIYIFLKELNLVKKESSYTKKKI